MSNHKKQPQKPQGGMPGFGAPVAKPKDFKKSLYRLLKYLAPQKFKFLIVIVCAIFATLFGIVGPKILGMATTILAEGAMAKLENPGLENAIDFHAINTILCFLFVLYLIRTIFTWLMGYIMSGVAQKTVYNMRNEVKLKLDRVSLKYYDSTENGEIISRLTNDMDNIANTLQQSMIQIITSVISVVGILVMMFSISFTLSIIAIIMVPLSGLIIAVIMKKSQVHFKNQQKDIGILTGKLEEVYANQKTVKMYNKEEAEIEEFKVLNENLAKDNAKANFISGVIFPILNFIGVLGYVLISILGSIMIGRGTISVGDVQAMIQYMKTFSQPLVAVASIMNVIQSTVASAERIFEVLDLDEEEQNSEAKSSLNNIKGEVEFRDVCFGYTEDKMIIKNFNFKVKAGETVAIVGPTGAGKTTLINLLMRFYEVNSGQIIVDGVDISEIQRDDLRKNFGMVLQDTWLFKGSIFDNIAYGSINVTEDQVYAAADSSYVHRFIKSLPHSYKTEINEDASNISQGQKQLMTIARTLIKDPNMLILDEATSNVDTRTEQLIQKAMTKIMSGRTSFVIAHRLSTIKNADKIIVMKDGSIIEQGNHKELLAQNGFYASLYHSQFED